VCNRQRYDRFHGIWWFVLEHLGSCTMESGDMSESIQLATTNLEICFGASQLCHIVESCDLFVTT
jgi:hypothetical protein